MDPIVASHAQLMALNTVLFKRCVDGLSDEELWRRPSDHSNPLFWIAGHITTSRRSLLRLLGGTPAPLAWEPVFDRHERLRPREDYPAFDAVLDALKDVNQHLKTRMEEATDEQLAAPSPRQFPGNDQSVRSAIAFFAFHDTYHVGQLSYLRKWLGYPGVVD